MAIRGLSMPGACDEFRATVKGNLCRCGYAASNHDAFALIRSEWKWGWRARALAQPDLEDCE